MKKLAINLSLFIFFCLISCKMPGEYRDIEISILNAQQGTVYIIRLPDEKQIHSEYFDMEYVPEGIVHISGIPDGKYKLQVIADEELREEIFEYTGRKGLMVEF